MGEVSLAWELQFVSSKGTCKVIGLLIINHYPANVENRVSS
jgi:hypothetical protein